MFNDVVADLSSVGLQDGSKVTGCMGKIEEVGERNMAEDLDEKLSGARSEVISSLNGSWREATRVCHTERFDDC